MKIYVPVLVAVSVFFVVLFLFRIPMQERAGYFEMSGSGSKFFTFQSSPKIHDWHEWWYVNFHQEEPGLDGRFLFFTHGDLNSPKNIIGIHSKIFKDSALFVSYNDIFFMEDYQSVEEATDLRMGENWIKMTNEDTTKIHVEREGEGLEVNLEMKRLATGFSKKEYIFGDEEDVFWIAPMPLAKVEGVIEYGGESLEITGWGYHDHNYGIWDEIKWIWGEMGDYRKNVSIVFIKAVLENQTKGGIIMLDGEDIVFQILYPSYELAFEESVFRENAYVPVKIAMSGEGSGYSVEITGKNMTESSEMMLYTGNVSYQGNVIHEFDNLKGFFEYSYI